MADTEDPTPAPRLPRDAGIAIGPILFVLAMLGVLAVAMSSGIGQYGTAGNVDRISADVASQANLIVTKINECNLKYGSDSNFDGYPPSDITNGTLVSNVACEGDPTGMQNLWTGQRATNLPPPTTGFDQWYYINSDNCTPQTGNCLTGTTTGGRCIWTQPLGGSGANSTAVIDGLTKVASKFTHATSNDGVSQINYDPTKTGQRFVVWITLPTGSPDPHCVPQ